MVAAMAHLVVARTQQLTPIQTTESLSIQATCKLQAAITHNSVLVSRVTTAHTGIKVTVNPPTTNLPLAKVRDIPVSNNLTTIISLKEDPRQTPSTNNRSEGSAAEIFLPKVAMTHMRKFLHRRARDLLTTASRNIHLPLTTTIIRRSKSTNLRGEMLLVDQSGQIPVGTTTAASETMPLFLSLPTTVVLAVVIKEISSKVTPSHRTTTTEAAVMNTRTRSQSKLSQPSRKVAASAKISVRKLSSNLPN